MGLERPDPEIQGGLALFAPRFSLIPEDSSANLIPFVLERNL